MSQIKQIWVIFTHLKLWVAVATHNFKRVKILIGGPDLLSGIRVKTWRRSWRPGVRGHTQREDRGCNGGTWGVTHPLGAREGCSTLWPRGRSKYEPTLRADCQLQLRPDNEQLPPLTIWDPSTAASAFCGYLIMAPRVRSVTIACVLSRFWKRNAFKIVTERSRNQINVKGECRIRSSIFLMKNFCAPPQGKIGFWQSMCMTCLYQLNVMKHALWNTDTTIAYAF